MVADRAGEARRQARREKTGCEKARYCAVSRSSTTSPASAELGFAEVVLVDLLNLVDLRDAYPHLALDHQACEASSVNQDYPLRYTTSILLRAARKSSSRNENALCCSLTI